MLSALAECYLLFANCSSLRVNSAQLDRMRHAADGQHVGRDAVVDAVRFREVHDVLKRLFQNELQLLVDRGLFPEVALAVLHPLEVRGGDAPGVGQNVGNDEDLFIRENFIGRSRGRTVGAFHYDFGFDVIGVLAGDDVLGGGGDEDFAVGNQKLFGVGGFRAGEPVNALGSIPVFQQIVDVDALRVEQAAVELGDADDLVARVGHQFGG